MRHRSPLLLMFAALALSATPALAQYVTSGSRIRLTTPAVPDEWIVGRLLTLSADSLSVDVSGGAATLMLGVRDVERMERSHGRARWGWAVLGAKVGFVGAAALGTLYLREYGNRDWAPVGGFMYGLVLGAPLGAGIGAFAAPERWSPYPLPRNIQ